MSLTILQNVPYPEGNPLYSVSEYLSPGVTRLGGSTGCWVQVTENLVIASFRVNPSGATGTGNTIAEGLPQDFWPSVNTPDTAQQQIFLMNDGRVWMRPAAGNITDRTEINALFIAPRRAG